MNKNDDTDFAFIFFKEVSLIIPTTVINENMINYNLLKLPMPSHLSKWSRELRHRRWNHRWPSLVVPLPKTCNSNSNNSINVHNDKSRQTTTAITKSTAAATTATIHESTSAICKSRSKSLHYSLHYSYTSLWRDHLILCLRVKMP